MKRPAPTLMPRAPRAAARPPRTRTEAAVALVRVEFERERHERDLAVIARREALAETAHEQCVQRSRTLRRRLDDDPASPVPAGPRR